jgi:radical SAM protein with 4Fe4S-binding SPASM domain
MALPSMAIQRRHLRLGRLLIEERFRLGRTRAQDGRAGRPVTIHLQPTLACNLACRMCIQNGPAGYLRGSGPLVKAHLPLAEWEKFLRPATSHGPFVHVWGGEPLLYKEIDELIALLRRLDLPVMLTTNAVRGQDHLEALMQLDVLRISVDGPAAVHDEVRGRPGTFQAVVGLIRAVVEERRRRRSYWPRIVTNSLLIDETYRHLLDTVQLLAELPVDRCDLSLPMFTTPERGRAYERILAKEWGAEARAWKGFMIEGLTMDLSELCVLLTRVKGRYSRTKFNLFPIGDIRGVRDWFERLDHTFGFPRCHALTDNLNVLPNGDVTLCNDLPDLIIGNITTQSFPDIWNGEIARSFRTRVAQTLLPVCSRCCMLYSFPLLQAGLTQRWLR